MRDEPHFHLTGSVNKKTGLNGERLIFNNHINGHYTVGDSQGSMQSPQWESSLSYFFNDKKDQATTVISHRHGGITETDSHCTSTCILPFR